MKTLEAERSDEKTTGYACQANSQNLKDNFDSKVHLQSGSGEAYLEGQELLVNKLLHWLGDFFFTA